MWFHREEYNDQYIEGLGWISKNGENFLPSIVRLEEILSGRRSLLPIHTHVQKKS